MLMLLVSLNRPISRRQPPRIPHEQRCKPNIRQPQKELRNAIQPQPPPSMRRTPIPKSISIMPKPLRQWIERRVVVTHVLAELLVVVDALRPGHDFLAAHEEVVGICEVWVLRIGVRVEGADGAGEFVDGVEVGGVLVGYQAAEGFFLGGAVGGSR